MTGTYGEWKGKEGVRRRKGERERGVGDAKTARVRDSAHYWIGGWEKNMMVCVVVGSLQHDKRIPFFSYLQVFPSLSSPFPYSLSFFYAFLYLPSPCISFHIIIFIPKDILEPERCCICCPSSLILSLIYVWMQNYGIPPPPPFFCSRIAN